MSDSIPDFDAEALVGHPTSLRAAAAAFGMMLSGERPSLSRVAKMAATTRQNLHAHHKAVVELVSMLRASWEPPTSDEVAILRRKLDEAESWRRRETKARKRAEADRDKALHHLALSDATVRELSRMKGNVTALRPTNK